MLVSVLSLEYRPIYPCPSHLLGLITGLNVPAILQSNSIDVSSILVPLMMGLFVI